MISLRSKILLLALYLLICVTAVAAHLLQLEPAGYIPLYASLLGVPVAVAGGLLIMRLYNVNGGAAAEYQRFVGDLLVVICALVLAFDVYRMLILPLGGITLDRDGYNRVLLIAVGLVCIGFGNVIPKLPYPKMRGLLDVGPARFYRLNRFSGWICVLSGLVFVLAGAVVSDMPGSLVDTITTVIIGLQLLFYIFLHVRYAISWRHESRAQ